MKKADFLELERLLELTPKSIDEIIDECKVNLKNYNMDSIKDANQIAQLKSSAVFFLSKNLSSYFVLNGIKQGNISMILNGCAIEDRTMLLRNIFYIDSGQKPTHFIWDVLKSLVASDSNCVQKYFELLPDPPKAMFELYGITNTIRGVIYNPSDINKSNLIEISNKKSSNKFCECCLKLLRTVVENDKNSFEQDCIELLKNYRRWAASNYMYGETFIPLKAIGLIKFAIDYSKFDLPNLEKVNQFILPDLTELLTAKIEFPPFDKMLIDKWGNLFNGLNNINNISDISLN